MPHYELDDGNTYSESEISQMYGLLILSKNEYEDVASGQMLPFETEYPDYKEILTETKKSGLMISDEEPKYPEIYQQALKEMSARIKV